MNDVRIGKSLQLFHEGWSSVLGMHCPFAKKLSPPTPALKGIYAVTENFKKKKLNTGRIFKIKDSLRFCNVSDTNSGRSKL